MSAATAPVAYAPPLLWAAARVLITTIFALFGDSSAIALQHTHRQSACPPKPWRRQKRRLLLKWLRASEALMRHLLLIEAGAHPNG
ncbi:MAG: hypothetical protein IPL62_13690 [Caulobacteraceae bacterium]|nr:hypothetical protein [Caulobacteraceae bacterium]